MVQTGLFKKDKPSFFSNKWHLAFSDWNIYFIIITWLKIFPERVIEEACLCDLPILVFVHDELRGLARRINDQWITVESRLVRKIELWNVPHWLLNIVFVQHEPSYLICYYSHQWFKFTKMLSHLLSMIAFSVQRSSVGRLCDCHWSLWSGSDKNSVLASSDLYVMLAMSRWCFQAVKRFCLKRNIFSIIVDEGLSVRISAKKLKTFALNKCFITQTFAR